jgi:hypothetical protein
MAVLEGFIDQALPRNIDDQVSHHLANMFLEY